MELSSDCIRDVLLSVKEEASGADDALYYKPDSAVPDRLKPYDDATIRHHVHQCNLSGYLNEYKDLGNGAFIIGGLTPAGRAFLNQPIDNQENTDKLSAFWSGAIEFGLEAIVELVIAIFEAD